MDEETQSAAMDEETPGIGADAEAESENELAYKMDPG